MTRQAFTTDQLTESQRRAVFHKDGPLLVIAGPGSGKTRVITSRIAALIDAGVRPWNICAITFTNKAAEEMRERLAAGGGGEGVHTSTFHSLCVRLLRMYADAAGISNNFSIYDTDDQRRCVKEAIKNSNIDSKTFTPAKVLSAISNFKNDLETPEQILERADEFYLKTAGRVYEQYQKLLKKNNALDFDDLLINTAFLLRDNPDIRQALGNRYQYLLVDEYQDTNHAQYQIAKGLALEHRNICVTGDPDQSIYKWRGADIQNILMFEKDWPDAVVVKLEENFRSTPNILEMADVLIANNTQRKEKRLVATHDRGADAEIECYGDGLEESVEVAGKIQALIEEGADPNEIAVFYRVNSMSRTVEEAFVRQQIPYQVVRGVEFYARKEIRDMLSYMKVIANPSDDMALLRAVGTHSRGIGKMTLSRVQHYASQYGITMFNAMNQADAIDTITPRTQTKVKAFAAMIEKWRADADGPVAPLMERVFDESGLLDSLRAGGEDEESAIENIDELINSASRYDEMTEEPSLIDYLQSIALYSDTDAYDAEAGRVSLMTLHAAKGLEFDNVFIIGLEEGLLPHERSLVGGEEELEEERRLFFVGITRARKVLHISHARYRTMRGQHLRTTPSKFLYEIGYTPKEEQFESYTYDTEFSQVAPSGFGSKIEKKEAPFRTGELVEHRKFGTGRVKEFQDMGDNSIIVVRFQSGQVKTLMLKYANLTKLSG
ncbi:ATP-dependent DNA helicase PcrA [Anaerohalosphaera lusitana]|uniref:DNA 3'-5' helicase n=1 Tax=Anaerohalosphaera lusitana TaxID=1936003 RepID=A0A1U9NLS4_9BACT|nr:UvrD-helicase domain-containing protein [Anaerohalosphaera lusitana]AQT68859.1 ATP-dependent DNA helicase PcrA [Anaerohalosphaera lusitana]